MKPHIFRHEGVWFKFYRAHPDGYSRLFRRADFEQRWSHVSMPTTLLNVFYQAGKIR